MDAEQTKKEIFSGAFWAKLLEYHRAGYLLGAGSPAGSDTDTSPEGIVQGHAYAILDIQEVDDNKLLHLRNPWYVRLFHEMSGARSGCRFSPLAGWLACL